MKGFIFNGAGDITLKELDLAKCGDNDIVVKNICAGICGTDISAYQHGGDGVRIFKGSEFGHEMVSRVVEVGKNVQGINVGDRVYPYPTTCKDDRFRSATVGGFSEYVHMPNCRLNYSVYKVDDEISDLSAAMIEPFTVGGRAARLSSPGKGKKAIVFGAGIIGMAAAITLKYRGCDKVMMADLSDFRLAKAEKLGFEICNSGKEDIKEKAMKVFGGAFGVAGQCPDVDIYIDATGAAAVLDTFLGLAKLNAGLTIVGIHHAPRTINLTPVIFGSLAIRGSGGYFPEDVETAMEIMKSKQFDIDSLVTHKFPLEELEEAIKTASNADIAQKVVIQY